MSNRKIRVYQQKVVNVLKEMEKQGNYSTIVELPTGGGKTFTVGEYLREQALAYNCKVLWLTHRDALLDQAEKEFEGYKTIKISNTNERISSIGVDDTDVVLALFTSMNLNDSEKINFINWIKKAQEDDKRLFIVVDEAHHVGAHSFDTFFEDFFINKCLVTKYALIGLTATPYRGDLAELNLFKWFKNGYIEDFSSYNLSDLTDSSSTAALSYLQPNKSFFKCVDSELGENPKSKREDNKIILKEETNNVIKVIELGELIKYGVLIEPDFFRVDDFVIKTDVTTKESIAKSIVENINNSNNLGKTVIFAEDISTAEIIQKGLEAKAELYISKNKGIDFVNNNKEDALDRFKMGKVDILVTVDVISEGADIPDLNTVILVGATHSNIRLRQRIGRVLRKTKDKEKEARVIWYYYAKDDEEAKEKIDEFVTSNKGYSSLRDQKSVIVKDGSSSFEYDIVRPTFYLTAPEYKTKMGYISEYSIYNSETWGELLDILSLFRDNHKELEDYIGFYKLVDGEKIYLNKYLHEGFMQLFRRVRSEWLMIGDETGNYNIADSKDFFDKLEIFKDDYLIDVKKICFFLSNPKKKSIFYVNDDNIITFIDSIFAGGNREPEFIGIHANLIRVVNEAFNNKGITYTGREDECAEIANDIIQVSKEQLEECEIDISEDTPNGVCNRAMLEEIVKEHILEENRTTDAIWEKIRAKKVQTAGVDAQIELKDVFDIVIKSEHDKKAENYKKKFGDDKNSNQSKERKEHGNQLRFREGDTEVIFSEIEDLGKMIRLGYNWSSKPVKYTCEKCGKDVPIVSMKVSTDCKLVCADDCKGINHFKKLKPNCKYGLKIICQSILVNTHHIVVSDKDVEDLRETVSRLVKELKLTLTDTEKEDLTKDIVCKLGTDTEYNSKNNTDTNIIAFVELLHDYDISIPRYVAYLLYDKIYEYTWRNVSFWNETKYYLSARCQNKDDLIKAADAEMKRISNYTYKFLKTKGLTPVEDAISDYRPYVKVLQSYQGIKPDLLCRMMNLIVNQDKTFKHFITGCGGSAAGMINRFQLPDNIEQETYNEYGYLLTNFFEVLKNKDSYKNLKKLVKKFLGYVINYSEDNIKNGIQEEFTEKIYINLQKYETVLDKKIQDLEKNVAVLQSKNSVDKVKIENLQKEKICIKEQKGKISDIITFCDSSNKSTLKQGIDDRKATNEIHNKGKDETDSKFNEMEKSPNIIKLLYSNPIIYKYYMNKYNNDKTEAEKNIRDDMQLRENVLHGVYHRFQKLYLWCQSVDDDTIKATGIDDVYLAFVVFLYYAFPDRYLFDNCFIEHFIDFAASYDFYLEMGHERVLKWNIINNVTTQSGTRDVVEVLLLPEYNEKDSVTYCDIPYAETDSTLYVASCFDFDRFVTTLSNFVGKYIVSSRYNICSPAEVWKMYYGIEEVKYRNFSNDEIIHMEQKELKEKFPKIGGDFNTRVSNIRKFYKDFKKADAKYIVLPYTSVQEILNTEPANSNDKLRKAKVHNNYALTLEDVERMFKNTIYSNIPVEVMVTNIDMFAQNGVGKSKEIKSEEQYLMEEYRLGEGVYVIPSVKADAKSSAYFAEPLYLVLEYEKYLDYMQRNLDQDAAIINNAKDDAEFFQQYLYSNKKMFDS